MTLTESERAAVERGKQIVSIVYLAIDERVAKDISNTMASILATITRLEAENAALRVDGERLDWLEGEYER